jgi:hypothetical protein
MITGICIILLQGFANGSANNVPPDTEVCVRVDGKVDTFGSTDAAARLFYDYVERIARERMRKDVCGDLARPAPPPNAEAQP